MEELRKKLVFNRSIASYILNKPVKRVEEWENCVFVVAHGMRPRFVSKKKFFEAFVSMRKERAEGLALWQTSTRTYTVHNPENGNRYTITLKTGSISCTCEDYNNQVTVWKKGACKHIYRVLTEIGCSSLREYEKATLNQLVT